MKYSMLSVEIYIGASKYSPKLLIWYVKYT